LVQQGISEKVALVVSFLSSFFTGFILAYVRQWKLALALSSIIPCIGITGGIMNKVISSSMQRSLGHVADGGTIAEEVISTIRTAHAFGSQPVLATIYNSHILKARKTDLRAAVWQGGGMAVFFFVIYSSYGLGEKHFIINFGSHLLIIVCL
jgi:ATP-binding cassette, subfamily B (MDR/TAP), member 1